MNNEQQLSTLSGIPAQSNPEYTGHICVIDGSNMIHRAWAMGQKVNGVSGEEVGATVLFGAMVMKLLRQMLSGRRPPTHIAIFFDPSRESTWRREIYSDYKAARPAMEEDFARQIPLMKDLCLKMGIAHATAPRHEADDLIAAYAEDAVANSYFCSIISGDKDLMQLVRKGVLQYSPIQKKWFNEEAVFDKFGVKATQVGDYLALAGDTSDGIPGAPGIGPKSAAVLLNKFGTIGEMLRRSDEIERKSWRKILSENKEVIRMSRTLVSLDHAAAPRSLSLTSMRAPDQIRAWQGLQDWKSENLQG